MKKSLLDWKPKRAV